MTGVLRVLALAAAVLTSFGAGAAGYGQGPHPYADATGPLGGRAPWQYPWEYDTGGDNDRQPARPYYQQGRGQQTGGPARNLLPKDRFHIFPR